ncbi:class I tRNA ligase family protein [Amycolatopsis sp. PS_44_ISF1]|uniref:class I tRNA ligase family protein n=1 Tax=Amycolatopsis sp. PS_44_ISF1 TaxID=2974917 RepID=UPI0028DED448|nr:class I tRNA ligase family protein [Amycolatopsis sp. PS_44_ISF1]MDT8912355.1 class I tRNA ligase family protein [Amycolatopsis sp. PS_44_ISF1]
MTTTTGRVLITCAPPNPNGDLHLGHLSGPFFGADVLRRHLVSRGAEVSYVSYTDDHSCYLPRRAAEIGRTPHETALHYTRRIEQSLALAGMLPDYYEHPHRETRHDQVVRREFLKLWEAGMVEEQELPTAYCEQCAVFRYEAQLRGNCRFCASPSDGTYCEECGLPQDIGGLNEAKCTTCWNPVTTRLSRRLVFPLARWASRLSALYAHQPWRRRVLDYCEKMVAAGLPDTPISRIDPYGIEVPLPGWEGHILDTWFSGIFGYLAATEAHAAALGDPGLAERSWTDPDTTLVHFIGFDCSFSHAVLWPALLMALDRPVLPRHVISNEFYALEGGKFSTSRGWAIWASDFLREVPADAARFHLALTNPATERTDFRRAEFDHTVRTVLGEHLDGWAGAVLDGLAAQCDSVLPEERAAAPRERAAALAAAVAEALDPAVFLPRSAASAVAESVAWAAGELKAALAAEGAEPRAVLGGHAELLATVAAVAAPLLPNWSRRVAGLFELPVTGWDELPVWPEDGVVALPGGQRIGTAYPRVFATRSAA